MFLLDVFIGLLGIAVMMTNWELLPGLVFDTRSVLLSISGLFFGAVPTLLAVAMTAHAMLGDRERCMAVGMNDYVTKPVSPQALLEALEKGCRRKKYQQAPN
jgi:CheY-like chemotaxis protein